MDNLRREMAKQPASVPDWWSNPATKSLLPEREKLPAYLQSFSRLTEAQRSVMGRVIEAFARFQETVLDHISLLFSKSKSRRKRAEAARDKARGALVVLGATLVHQLIVDAADGKADLLIWYRDFVSGLDQRTRLAWSELDYVLSDESLPLYEAWLLKENTAETKTLNEVLQGRGWR
jgi:hypothetical protein